MKADIELIKFPHGLNSAKAIYDAISDEIGFSYTPSSAERDDAYAALDCARSHSSNYLRDLAESPAVQMTATYRHVLTTVVKALAEIAPLSPPMPSAANDALFPAAERRAHEAALAKKIQTPQQSVHARRASATTLTNGFGLGNS